ncbi:MAG: D-alanyl-D-alanine carboxypeptidase [Rickettsiales bacterium]|nr:D-alanyl-D-alanine carboxypeptidase [Rickettsiales bacterium]
MLKTLLGASAVWVFAAQAAIAFDTSAKQALLVDTSTNTVLLEKAAYEKMYPSSMSKLMTLYVLFERLKQGGLSLDDQFLVSEKAWRKGGSKMFVRVNEYVSIEDLIRGIIVQSGNDACIVVAEGLAGSEKAFAELMNKKAEEIGLKGSHFVNSTGWPDDEHYMTAEDLYLLSHKLKTEFPDYYPYFAEEKYTYNNITQFNRNKLLSKGIGVDGLKTGHTEVAGYGITLAADQDGRSLVLVVNGLDSETARMDEGERLLQHGFRDFVALQLADAGTQVDTADVWMGEKDTVSLSVAEDLHVSLPRNGQDELRYIASYDAPLQAPIEAGTHVGTLRLVRGETELKSVPLMAAESVEASGFFGRIRQNLAHSLGL